MTPNEKLVALYKDRFLRLSKKLNSYNEQASNENLATNPFLISVPDNYHQYKKKVMIFGQETNCWCGECGNDGVFSNNIDKSIEIYDKFYWEQGFRNYKGAFWNEFRRLRNEILSLSDRIVVYNNINKIGRIGKGNVDAINKIQFVDFAVIKDELEITEPNVVILFTGPDYDEFIRQQIGDFSSEAISDNILQLKFFGEFEKVIFLKTYHPQALYRQKLRGTVIPSLIEEIRKNL